MTKAERTQPEFFLINFILIESFYFNRFKIKNIHNILGIKRFDDEYE